MQSSGCGNEYISYTIAKGQTLYAIAKQFNTTVAEILAANPALDVQLYYAGDVICIPRPGISCHNGTPYTIKRGDSFYLISQRYGIPLANLISANPGVDPARLQVGQIICIPGIQPPPRCPDGQTVHTVTRGQSFTDILVLYNISYAALQQANKDVNIGSLQVDQTLCIPPTGSRGTCASGIPPHLLATGDTLSVLAARYQTSVSAILATNATMAPTDFIPGRLICLPQGAVLQTPAG